jgi:cytochrome c peroxidase
MHNGSFLTIDAVLEHYNREVKTSPTLYPLLQQNGTLGIPLTAAEKTQIKAFLKTLDDETFIRDRRFSEF